MINQERIVEEFMKYVQIDSPTKNEKEFAEFIAKELKRIGFDVHIDNAGEKIGSNTGNVIARIEGNKKAEPILFSCHMDTVSPSIGIKPMIKDGIIYSDGTTVLGADDKAGIAAVVEALKVIKEEKIDHGPIEIVFSIYEEGGLLGVKHLDMQQIQSQKVFVLDSGGSPGEIIIQGPAHDAITAKMIGKSAHAGVAPEEGISAIMIAADAISNMNLLRIDSETTANIGIIQGGEATNIVASEVIIQGEARSLDNEKLEKQTNHMIEQLEKSAATFGGKVEIDVERQYSAFKLEEEEDIVQQVKAACKNINITPYMTASGGGSDTNIFNSKGMKAINLGIGEKNPHTLEEHISIEDLATSAKLVLEIIKTAK